ncbi:hypothetical protein CBM2637_B150093 [Cupriavidus taiwanensis]|nr:hypothetical protein CBM2637_B150093 [Cupriavidus taiwanensis]
MKERGWAGGRVLAPAGVQRLLPRKIYPARQPRQRCHSCPRREFVLQRNMAEGRTGRQAGIRRRVRHLAKGTLAGRRQRLSLHSDFSYDAAQYTGR